MKHVFLFGIFGWFYHEDFIKGGTLELQLGTTPNKKWGIEEFPPSSVSSDKD
jgi:putative alpha-1,2-mannosidase